MHPLTAWHDPGHAKAVISDVVAGTKAVIIETAVLIGDVNVNHNPVVVVAGGKAGCLQPHDGVLTLAAELEGGLVARYDITRIANVPVSGIDGLA